MSNRVVVTVLVLAACATTDPNAPDPHTTVPVEPPAFGAPPAAGQDSATPVALAGPDLGPIASDLPDRIARFVQVPISVDDAKLDARTKSMLRKLIEAAQLMHQIALRQVDPQNPALRARLAADARYR